MFTISGFCDDAGNVATQAPGALMAYIRQHFKGKDFTLTVKARETKRSLAQNRMWWGHILPAIAEHCGYDHHEHEHLHYDILAVRFGTEAIPPLLPGAPPRIEPKRTSSQLSVKEFNELIEWTVRWAAQQFGLVIDLPDEVAA
jgi:hypothetical protein